MVYVTGMTVEALRDCLVATAPVDLLGMRLLEQSRPQSGLYPSVSIMETQFSREILTQAVSEIVDYTGRCTAVAGRLSHLAPIPLTTIEIFEFGL